MNAGAAHFHVCPPIDTSTSCRSTSNGDQELFRFQPGGFCVTDQVRRLGAGTGYVRRRMGRNVPGVRQAPPEKGWYDWASGAFKVAYRGRRPVCGALDACIGDRGEWTGQIVATPSPTSPNPPPCLGNPGDTCTPATTCLP